MRADDIDTVSQVEAARHLASYISDPSAIRSYLAHKRPELEPLPICEIKGMIADSVSRREPTEPYARGFTEDSDDGEHWRPRGLVKAPKAPYVRPAPPEPEPKLTRGYTGMWPTWYRPQGKRPPAHDLMRMVAEIFGLNVRKLVGKDRSRTSVGARIVVVRILRERQISFPVIGRLLGGRDHSSIINLSQKYEVYARRDPLVAHTYKQFREVHDG